MEPWPTGKGRPRAGQKLRCGGDSDRPSSSLRKSGRKATVTSEVFRLGRQKGMIPSRRLFPLEPVDKVAKAAGETAGDSGTVAFPTLMPAIHRADGSVVVGQRLQPRVLAGPVAIEDLRLLPPAHRRARGLNVSACSRRSAGWWCGWRRTPPGVRVSAMNSSIRCFRGGAPVAFIAASDSAGSSTFTIGRREGVRHGSAHSWDITASPKAGGKGREIRLGAILSVGDTSQRVQPLHA